MGEHDVAVAFDQQKFAEEPMKTAPNNGAGKTGSASTSTAGSTSTSANRNDNWHPDHVVLDANKDQPNELVQLRTVKRRSALSRLARRRP